MNTDINNESLEKAIFTFYPEHHRDYYTEAEREAFARGVNWQKQQDKAIQDKLIEALKAAEEFIYIRYDDAILIPDPDKREEAILNKPIYKKVIAAIKSAEQ